MTLYSEKSIYFVGDQYITLGSASSLDSVITATGEWSIVLWFRDFDLTKWESHFDRHNTVGNGTFAIQLAGLVPPKIRLYCEDSVTGADFRYDCDAPLDNEWHCYAITKSISGSDWSGAVTSYIDGKECSGTVVNNGAISSVITSSLGNINIGRRNGTTADNNVRFDDSAIYDKELSATEVKEIYNFGNPINLTELDSGSNLVGYWYLGDGDTYPTILDYSGNANSGTMTNMSASNIVIDAPRAREAFYSILLDGIDEDVNIGNVSEISFERTDSFSFSCWFKSTGKSGFRSVFGKSENSGTFAGYWLAYDHSTSQFFYRMEGSAASNKIEFRTVETGFDDGEWHHVILSYDGTSTLSGTNLYVDNVLLSKTSTQENLTSSILTTQPLRIGARGAASNYWIGNICEVSVFDKDLSLMEIQDLYNSGKPIDARTIGINPNLVGYWPLDDIDTYPTFTDLSISGNDGTATNMESTDIKLDAPGINFFLPSSSEKSIEFTSGSIEINASELTFERTDAFSISAWIKTTSSSPQTIIGNLEVSPEYKGWELGIESSSQIRLLLVHDFSLFDRLAVDTNKSFNDGEWHHVVTNYFGDSDATTVEIFVDGVKSQTTVVYDALTSSIISTSPINIGARVIGGSPFDGNIDDVAVWNRVLTEVEVRTLYNTRSTVDILERLPIANLQGYWKMGDGYDEFGVIKDLSENNNDGYMKGDLDESSVVDDYPSELLSSYALDFDGINDKVVITTNSDLDFDRYEPFTLAFWGKKVVGASGVVIGNRDSTASFRGWEFVWSNVNGLYLILDGGAGSTNRIDVYTNPTVYEEDRWYHIAVSFDGSGSASGVRMFVDGAEVSTVIFQDLLVDTTVSTANVTIGARNGDTNFFDGLLDGISIYNRVLSPSEIFLLGTRKRSIDYGAYGPIDSLIGWWRMGDNATYPTIQDDSVAQENDGTMTNMVISDIVDEQVNFERNRMRGFVGSEYFNWNSTFEDFNGLDTRETLDENSESIIDTIWNVETTNYRMRAEADPGPGYVYWNNENEPDFDGTNAPSAIIAGTAVVIDSGDQYT